MCTLMQKDVLIEMVANTIAIINYRTPPDVTHNEEQSYLINLRDYLYSTHHDNIDYKLLSTKIKGIREQYIDLPIHQYYK